MYLNKKIKYFANFHMENQRNIFINLQKNWKQGKLLVVFIEYQIHSQNDSIIYNGNILMELNMIKKFKN
jgi:hypothetical protein